MIDDIFVATGVSEGEKVRLTRALKRLRQVDVASLAGVQPIDITRLEKDRYVLPAHRMRILEALGLETEDSNGQ